MSDVINFNSMIDNYLSCIRYGTKTISDIDDSKIRDEVIKIVESNIANGRSTGHERKAIREYNKSIGKE